MKRAPEIIVQLIHLYGPMKGEIQEFSDDEILIGRHPDSRVRFPADLAVVSRKHAEIVRDGNRFKLIDLSTNGTLVNGKWIKEEVFLKNGDVLTFSEGGPKVSFLFQIKEDPSGGESVPDQHKQATPIPPLDVQPVKPPPQLQPQIQVAEPETPLPQPANVPLILQYGPTLRSFKQLPVTIGKHPNCQFTIDHPAILDMHAQVFYSRNEYWVKDLTGKDFVLINGQPAGIKASPLRVQDILALSPQGPSFRFLGEGRLAEIEVAPSDESSEQSEQQDPAPKSDADQEHKSIFRKFFK